LNRKDVAKKQPEDATAEPTTIDAYGTLGPSPESHPLEPMVNISGPATPPPIPPENNVEPPEA
jgi:hypothetical protein